MYFALYVCLMEEICEKVEKLQFNCADCRKLVKNKIPVKSWNLVFFTRQVFGKTNPSGKV